MRRRSFDLRNRPAKRRYSKLGWLLLFAFLTFLFFTLFRHKNPSPSTPSLLQVLTDLTHSAIFFIYLSIQFNCISFSHFWFQIITQKFKIQNFCLLDVVDGIFLWSEKSDLLLINVTHRLSISF